MSTTRPRKLVARGPRLDPDDPFGLGGGTAPARVEVAVEAIDAPAAACFPDIYGTAAPSTQSLQEVSR